MKPLGKHKPMYRRIEGHGAWCSVCHEPAKQTKRAERTAAMKRTAIEVADELSHKDTQLENGEPHDDCELCGTKRGTDV